MRKIKKMLLVVAFTTILSVAIILALALGIQMDYPDNVHVRYGFPTVWAVHTLSTIEGAVDIWQVDIPSLLINLIVWLGLMVVSVAIIVKGLNNN